MKRGEKIARLERIAGEINAFLVVLALGLACLDATAHVALEAPAFVSALAEKAVVSMESMPAAPVGVQCWTMTSRPIC